MEDKSGEHQLSIANLVDNDAADKNAKTESLQPGPSNLTKLAAGEPEIGAPGSQDASANTESDTRCQNCKKPCPE